MYPNVQADYTVVPGVTMPQNSLVTLTDGSIVDLDDCGQIRGVLRGPTNLADDRTAAVSTLALGVVLSALGSGLVAGLAFHYYGKKRNPVAPAVVVGVSALLVNSLNLMLLLQRPVAP